MCSAPVLYPNSAQVLGILEGLFQPRTMIGTAADAETVMGICAFGVVAICIAADTAAAPGPVRRDEGRHGLENSAIRLWVSQRSCCLCKILIPNCLRTKFLKSMT